jgi:hypothetical protein
MAQVLHGSARTTGAVHRAIQHNEEAEGAGEAPGVNQKIVAHRKKRTVVKDPPIERKNPHSTVLTIEEEPVIVASRCEYAAAAE